MIPGQIMISLYLIYRQCRRWSIAIIITYNFIWRVRQVPVTLITILSQQTNVFFGAAQRWFRVGRMSSCHEYSELFFDTFTPAGWFAYSVFTLILLSHKCIILHNNPLLGSAVLPSTEHTRGAKPQLTCCVSWNFLQVFDSASLWLGWVNCDDAEDIQSMSMMCWNFSEAIISFNLFLISFLPTSPTVPHTDWEGNAGERCK